MYYASLDIRHCITQILDEVAQPDQFFQMETIPNDPFDQCCVPRYMVADGQLVQRTALEIAADITARTIVLPPTVEQRLAAAEEAILGLMMGE